MSEEEAKELRSKICYGLALSDWRMLKEKSSRGEQVVTSRGGKIAVHSAKALYKKLYGNSKEFVPVVSDVRYTVK